MFAVNSLTRFSSQTYPRLPRPLLHAAARSDASATRFAWILVGATAGGAQTERTRPVDVSRRLLRSLLVSLRLAAGRNRVDLCVSFRDKRE